LDKTLARTGLFIASRDGWIRAYSRAHDALVEFFQPAELGNPLFQRQAVDFPHLHRVIEPSVGFPGPEIEMTLALRQKRGMPKARQFVVHDF
jgi:hypothetical protein